MQSNWIQQQNRIMRILHISTDDYGGAGLCCLRIHQSLMNSGIESKVVVLNKTKKIDGLYQYGHLRDKISRIPSKILRILGFQITNRNSRLWLQKVYHAPFSLPISSVNLLKNEWVKWADIIHLHWVCNYLDYPSFFRGIDKPVVWTLHDEYFFYGIAHYSNQVLKDNEMEHHYAHLKREALSHVLDLNVVMLSNFFYNKFVGHELLEGRRVVVINNSIDNEVFKPALKSNAREKFGLREDDIVFAFTAVNINEKRKGLDVLSKVLSGMLDPRLKILAIGGNSENSSWINVISVGAMASPTDISEALSAADYYAMPSYQEAFAQSPMEAMACGLPVVVFPVSGTSELVNERNGVICDDFTPEGLEKGIKELMSNQYYPEEIRRDMIDRFSPTVIAKKYINLYNEILKDRM